MVHIIGIENYVFENNIVQIIENIFVYRKYCIIKNFYLC